MKVWRNFLLLVVAASALRAAPIFVERLELTDGRKLTNVTVRSYDADSSKVLLIARDTALAVPLAAFPFDLARRIVVEAPKSGATVMIFDDRIPSQATPSTSANATEAERMAPLSGVAEGERRIERPTSPAPHASGSGSARAGVPTVSAESAVAAHRDAALRHAERYYRFEFAAGSSQIRVTALDFAPTETKAVTGWPGRFRTEGKAFLEFFDSKGNSFSRTTDLFEVITEQTPDGPVHVASFRQRT